MLLIKNALFNFDDFTITKRFKLRRVGHKENCGLKVWFGCLWEEVQVEDDILQRF